MLMLVVVVVKLLWFSHLEQDIDLVCLIQNVEYGKSIHIYA